MFRRMWAVLALMVFCAACGGDDEMTQDTNNAQNNGENNAQNNGDVNNGDTNNGVNNEDPFNNFTPTPYTCDVTPSGTYMSPQGDSCDLIAQDCPQGEGCYLTGGAAECFPAAEDQASCGEPCDAGNECAPGQICAGEDKACLALCEMSQGCPGTATCEPLSGRSDLGVCVPEVAPSACSVLIQNCPDERVCYLVDGVQACARQAESPVAVGGRCEAANDCEPGLICVGPTANDLRCLQACNPTNDTACGGDACTPLAGVSNLGACF